MFFLDLINVNKVYFILDYVFVDRIDDLVQDCSNSNVLAVELLQSCSKPSICNAVNCVTCYSGL